MNGSATGCLAGKVILIVGGTGGIGASIADACAQSGARTAVTGPADGIADPDAAHLHIPADARNAAATSAAFYRTEATLGPLDGLVHVAGGSGRPFGDGPLHDVSDDAWEETLRLNLTSVFLSNREAVRRFLERRDGGAIVNIGSVLARYPSPDLFATHAYAAAKAGLEGLTRSAAARYASDNIRINTIAAGLTDTPMAARALSDDAIMAVVRARQPLDGGRAAHRSSYDGLAVTLLSDNGGFVTGQIICADGGWSVTDATGLIARGTNKETDT